jgi:Cu-Zn family superoxide dismutase
LDGFEELESAVGASRSLGLWGAVLAPVGGSKAEGTVEFVPEGSAMVIQARLSGLTPGEHGLHVHEIGSCSSPDGSSAGEHLAPEGDAHGSPHSAHEAHHVGDLGNLVADQSGSGAVTVQDDELELEGEHGVVGRAVVVHAGKDDFTTQPDGNSGDPAACGVIEVVEPLGRG